MDELPTTRPRIHAAVRRSAVGRALLGLLAACSLVVPACYTLVSHPGIPRQNYRRPPRDAACTSCHTRSALLSFVRSPRVAAEAEPWDRLSHPWWFDTRIAADSAAADSSGDVTDSGDGR